MLLVSRSGSSTCASSFETRILSVDLLEDLLASSQWLFSHIQRRFLFKSWFFHTPVGEVSPFETWFLKLVLPHDPEKFLHLSLSSSQ